MGRHNPPAGYTTHAMCNALLPMGHAMSAVDEIESTQEPQHSHQNLSTNGLH